MPTTKKSITLFQAIAAARTPAEVRDILDAILSESEFGHLKDRWPMLVDLSDVDGKSGCQAKIARRHGATPGKVGQWNSHLTKKRRLVFAHILGKPPSSHTSKKEKDDGQARVSKQKPR